MRNSFMSNITLCLRALSPILLFLLITPTLAPAQIPATSAVPTNLPRAIQDSLNEERVRIEGKRPRLRTRMQDQNAKCKPAPAGQEDACKVSQQLFDHDVAIFVTSVDEFNTEVLANRILTGMPALASRLSWSADERRRLKTALNGLAIDGHVESSAEDVNRVWTDMLAHGSALATEADKGKGPGMPGAGQQTRFQDCAVFALANASGQPYGVVAARLTKLMSEGDWRDPDERADPQAVIEKRGLYGGEVIMMAEALGRVEVINSKDFAKTLEGGRTVMVNVWPNGARGSHEVVLSKTFQHGGETWFEMMDSNQGPIRRLYLSHKDLMEILKENGVAYSRDPGTTPKLLRKSGTL